MQLMGPSGSGKTTLLTALSGRHVLTPLHHLQRDLGSYLDSYVALPLFETLSLQCVASG